MFQLLMVDELFMWLYSYNVLKEYLVCQQSFHPLKDRIRQCFSLYGRSLFFEIACLQ